MSVSDDWWKYIRTVGNEIAVKDFNVALGQGDLEDLIQEELTDELLDDLVQHMGRAFKPEMTRRSAFSSELFPMMPYIAMSTIEDCHTYAARVRTIAAAMPPEEIGRRLAQRAGVASPLWTWMSAYHYLCGRECLIHLGLLKADERIDEVREVVDFWRRLTLAQRGDGTLDNKDAGFTNRYLPDAEVEELVVAATPLGVDESKALKRLNATVSGYSFLHFTDSRVGIYDSGPYPVGNGQVAIVRDYLCLQPSAFGYPWAADLTAPYDGLTMVLTFDPAAFEDLEINDWGTTFTEPDQLLSNVSSAAVLGTRQDVGRVQVQSTEWSDLMADLSKTHLQLYETFAGMSREDRILSATRMYSWGLKPFAALAGVLDEIDWEISDATMALYPDPLDDDERAADAFATRILGTSELSSFSSVR